MKFNPYADHRRSIRLPGYDYSQNGAYSITICTHKSQNLFGDMDGDKVQLNDFGLIVKTEWLRSSEIRKELSPDIFIVMPNHFHGIVIIKHDGNPGRGVWPYAPTLHGTLPSSISSFVQGFKSTVTHQINEIRHTHGSPVWQRNYYEHVIRNEEDLNRIREYIEYNPARWSEDEENPSSTKKPGRI